MKTYFDCIPCAVRQVLDAVRMVTNDEAVQEKVLRESLGMWQRMDLRQSPPEMAQKIHRFLREVTGVADPYYEVKQRYNRLALDMVPELTRTIEQSAAPFETAVRLAIAGNIIDFGVNSNIEESHVGETVQQSLRDPLDTQAVQQLQEAVAQAKDILYLGDNAGEIVFDRLLIEQMPREKVTFVVRGAPVLNDVLVEDAEMVGLTEMVEVIDNGFDAPGTILDRCSDEFRRRFDEADLVIAKGQGNFESLNDAARSMFFLLRPKCAVLARHLGCDIGRLVVVQTGGELSPSRVE